MRKRNLVLSLLAVLLWGLPAQANFGRSFSFRGGYRSSAPLVFRSYGGYGFGGYGGYSYAPPPVVLLSSYSYGGYAPPAAPQDYGMTALLAELRAYLAYLRGGSPSASTYNAPVPPMPPLADVSTQTSYTLPMLGSYLGGGYGGGYGLGNAAFFLGYGGRSSYDFNRTFFRGRGFEGRGRGFAPPRGVVVNQRTVIRSRGRR